MENSALLSLVGLAATKHVFCYFIEKLATNRKQLVGRVSRLVVYPLKSAAGIELESAFCDWLCLEQGRLKDRSWLVVSESGVTLSQLQAPKLAVIQPTMLDDKLLLNAPGMDTLTVKMGSSTGPQTIYKFLRSKTAGGLDCGDEAAVWLSQFLGRSVRLVHATDDTQKTTFAIDQMYGQLYKPQDQAIYHFGAPHMIMSDASLRDLNCRRESPVDYRPFRPNILVDGCSPFDEDNWEKVFIADAELRRVKLCTRCPIVNTDVETGERRPDADGPLTTLREYRLAGDLGYKKNDPCMGVQFGIDKCGEVKVGDPVYVIKKKPERIQLVGL